MIIAEQRPTDPQSRRKRPSVWWLVSVSLIAHIVIALVLSLSFTDERERVKPPIDPIQARIIYPELAVEPEIVESPESNDVNELQPPVNESTVEETLENVPQTIDSDIASSSTQDVEEIVVSEEEPDTMPEIVTDTTLQDIDISDNAPNVTRPRSIANSATRKFLQQQQQAMLAQTAEQASAEFRRKITSPDLNLPEIEYEVSQIPGKPIIVACNKTAVNVLRILSQIAGGTLRCRDESNIDEFIQRRVEKR